MDKSRLGGLDRFKIVCALLVVAIHTSPLKDISGMADIILTKMIARIAVPFFVMTTGYFLLPQSALGSRGKRASLCRFLKKTALLYLISTILYLPVNLYAGNMQGVSAPFIIRRVLFDGTFYHLWYLPGIMTGAILVYIILDKFSYNAAVAISFLLYIIGLLGDSYYGIIQNGPLDGIYPKMFRLFSYTRNGLFFMPVFLVMGADVSCEKQADPGGHYLMRNVLGFAASFALMIAEGLTLHAFNVQRHDSMYFALLPCMYFLFRVMLFLDISSSRPLREISLLVYITHPMCIAAVRFLARKTHLEGIMIENHLVHYAAVCLLSLSCSVLAALMLECKRRMAHRFKRGRAWIELDMESLRKNVMALKGLLPKGCLLCPAVKANAYGHGAALIAKELNRQGVYDFCVATALEGMELRRKHIKGNILVLGYTHPEDFWMLFRYRLTQTVIDHGYARLLDSSGRRLRVQIKIDTGMHRLGEPCRNIDEICGMFGYKHLSVTGIYTHLCADETRSEKESSFTKKQAEAFWSTVSCLEKRGFFCRRNHLLASYGLINYPELGGDTARTGIALYGCLSERGHLESCPVSLYPVLSLKARVAAVKDLRKGENAGYGLRHIAGQDERIAVLTIGYADGIPRALSEGRGCVLINGKKAPVIGSICMDQMLADVTGISDVKAGDIATLIGRDGTEEITAYDLAEASGTITNEILSRLGSRLERIAL